MASATVTETRRERPILFNTEMVRAILDGKKTQTRRPAKERAPDPGNDWRECLCREIAAVDVPCVVCEARFGLCPFGRVGDRLWVRETWGPCAGGVCYRADEADTVCPDGGRWIPSIHMPRWASRITLEVTEVRVERLQSISERDAIAEGKPYGALVDPRSEYVVSWNAIYAKDGRGWRDNPFVWVVSFRRIT